MIPHSSDAISEETARYYAARAPEYDLSAGYLTLDADPVRVAKKKRYQQLFRGHDVLELACGTGYWTAVLAETAKSVVGIDVNPEMISRAQSRCEHLPACEIPSGGRVFSRPRDRRFHGSVRRLVVVAHSQIHVYGSFCYRFTGG